MDAPSYPHHDGRRRHGRRDDAGYGGAPDSPLDPMPTEEMRTQLGIPGYAPGVDGALEPRLTEMEIALAAADVRCRESSGCAQVQYDGRWDRQVEFIRANADREAWLIVSIDSPTIQAAQRLTR